MIKELDYFYDAQIKRFMEQVIRAFSGFQYRTGRREGLEPQLLMVPCKMAATDRMVAHILKGNSENTLLVAPQITVYITGLTGRRNDVQHLGHVEKIQVVERAIDPNTGRYSEERGQGFMVERVMPRPFSLEMNVDIWTTNMDQKLQISEQILTIIYPDFDIQNSENPIDWSALTRMNVENVTWSSRTIPVGTEGEIDIMTISLSLPFWLNPPAKVKQQKVIEQIVTNIHDARNVDEMSDQSLMSRLITTPGNHHVRVDGDRITLLGPKASSVDADGNPYDWKTLLDLFGKLEPTVSRIRLRRSDDLDDDSLDIVGTIQFDANDSSKLIWQIDVDTLPVNTMPPVDAVIDPRETWPGNGVPVPTNGTRYLFLHSLAGPSQAWGNLSAHENSIVEFENGAWHVKFDGLPSPSNLTEQHFVLNLYTGRQLKWTGYEWVLSIEGTYSPGYWRLQL